MIRPTPHRSFGEVIPLETPVKPPQIETPIIIARHRGRCGKDLCRQPIRIDEEIQRVGGRWHHAECVPADAVYPLSRRDAA